MASQSIGVDLDETFKKFLGTLDKIDTQLDEITDSLKQLRKFSGAINLNIKGLDQLAGKKVDVSGITRDLKRLFEILSSGTIAEGIKNFERVGSGLNRLFASIEKITKKNTGTLKKFITDFGGFAQLMGVISRILPGADAFRQLSLIFERFGIGIGGLLRNVEKIDKNSIKKLRELVTSLSVTFRILGSIVSVGGGAEKINNLAKIFDSVARLLRFAFININPRQLEKSRDLNAIMLRRISGIVSIVNAIRKIKGGNLANVADTLKAIGEIVRLMVELPVEKGKFGGTKDPFKNVAKNIDSLIKALGGLNKLKIRGNVAETIRGIADIFKNMDKIGGIGSSAEKFGFNLADSIRDGFIAAQIQIELFKFLANIFLRLNPVTITARFITGMVNVFLSLKDRIAGIFTSIGTQIKAFGDNLKSFGENLISNFGVGKLINSAAFGLATDFDSLIKQIEVFGGISGDALVQAKDLAFEIGQKFPLSANDAAAAILDLAKAGLEVPDIKQVLPTAAELASLTDSGDLGLVTKTLIGAAIGFKAFDQDVVASFENIGTAANIISAGADVSTASVESLSEGLANSSAAASNFGFSLEDTIATLAVFEDNNIRGAEAGTQLKSLLTNIRTKPAAKELQNLGVSLTNAEGSFKSIDTIVKELNDRYDELGFTESQRANSITKLAGSYGQAGLSFLLAADGINDTTERMSEVAPVTERAAELLNTMKGDVEQLQGSVETLMVRAFLPLINTIFRPLVKIMRVVIDTFLALDDETLALISTMVAFGSILATIIGFGSIIVGIFTSIGGSIIALGASFFSLTTIGVSMLGVLTGFITGLVAIVAIAAPLIVFLGALAAGFRAIIKIFQEDIGGAATSFNTLTIAIRGVLAPIAELFTAIIGITTEAFSGTGGLESLGEGLALTFSSLSSRLDLLAGKIRNVSEIFTGFFRFLRRDKNADAAAERTKERFGDLLPEDDLAAAADSASRAVDTALLNIAENLANNPILKGLLGDDLDANKIFSFFRELEKVLQGIKKGFKDVFGSVGTFFTSLARGEGLEAAVDAAKTRLVTGVKQLSRTLLIALRDIFKVDIGNSLQLVEQGQFGLLADTLIDNIRESLINAAIANRDSITDALVFIFRTFFVPLKIVGLIAKLFGIEELESIFNEFSRIITGAFEGIVNTIFNLLEGQDIKTALQNAFGPGIDPLLDFLEEIGNVIGNVIGLFADFFGVFAPSIASGEESLDFLGIVNNILIGLTDGLEFLNDNVLVPIRAILRSIDFTGLFQFFDRLFGGIVNLLQSLFSLDLGGVGESLGNILQTIVSAIKSVIDTIFGLNLGDSSTILDSIRVLITNLFSGIGDIINDILSSVPTIISDVAGFFLRLLGLDTLETSSVGTFVTGIAQKIGEALGQVPNALINLGDTFGLPILTKIGEALQSGNFQPALDQIMQTIANLLTGALQGIGNFLTNLGDVFAIPFLTSLGDAINPAKGGSLGAVINVIASAIKDVLVEALRLAGTLLTSIGDTFGIPFLTKLGDSINPAKGGSVSAAISVIAQGIVDAISAAISLVPTLFDTLGTTFDIPVLSRIAEALRSARGLEAIDEAAGAIADFIKGAIEEAERLLTGSNTAIFSIFNAIGNIFSFPAEAVSSIAEGIQAIVDAFNNADTANMQAAAIALTAIAVAGAGFVAFNIGGPILISFLTTLSATLLPLLSPIIIFVSAITLLKNVFEELDTVLSSLNLLFSGDFAGGIIKLVEGLGNIIAGFVSDVVGFFGLDISPDRIISAFQGMADQIGEILNLVGDRIADFFQDIVSRGIVAVLDFQASVGLRDRGKLEFTKSLIEDIESGATDLTAAQLRTLFAEGQIDEEAFTALSGIIEDELKAFFLRELETLDFSDLGQRSVNLTTLFNAIQNFRLSGTGDVSNVFADLILSGKDDVAKGIIQGLGDIAASDEVKNAKAAGIDLLFGTDPGQLGLSTSFVSDLQSNVLALLQSGDVTAGEALNLLDLIRVEFAGTDLEATGNQFISELLGAIERSGGALPPDQLAAFQTSIIEGFNNAQFTQAGAINLFDILLVSTTLTEEEKVRLRDGFLAAIDGTVADEPVPVEVPVTVTTTVTGDDVGEAVDTAVGQGEPVEVDVPVSMNLLPEAGIPPTLDLGQEITTAEIEELNIALTNTQIKVTETLLGVQPLLDSFIALRDTGLVPLQNQFVTTTSVVNLLWAFTSGFVILSTNNMTNALRTLNLEMGKLGLTAMIQTPLIVTNVGLWALAILSMGTQVETTLARIQEKIKTFQVFLAGVVEGIEQSISKINQGANDAINVAAGSGIPTAGGLASGGIALGSNIYEVNEQGRPEVLEIGNKRFLLPGATGKVTPAMALPSSTNLFGMSGFIGQPSNQPIVSGAQSIVINEGDITIPITTQPGQSSAEIAQLARDMVRQELRNRNKGFGDTLRTAGRG